MDTYSTIHPKRYTASGTLTNFLNENDISDSPILEPNLDLPVSIDPIPSNNRHTPDLTLLPHLFPENETPSSPRHRKILSRSASPLHSPPNPPSNLCRSSCLDELLSASNNPTHSPSFDTVFPPTSTMDPPVPSGLGLQTAFSLSSRPSETERYSSPPSPRMSMSPHVLVGRGVVSSSLKSGLSILSRGPSISSHLGLENSQDSSPKSHYLKKLTRSRLDRDVVMIIRGSLSLPYSMSGGSATHLKLNEAQESTPSRSPSISQSSSVLSEPSKPLQIISSPIQEGIRISSYLYVDSKLRQFTESEYSMYVSSIVVTQIMVKWKKSLIFLTIWKPLRIPQ